MLDTLPVVENDTAITARAQTEVANRCIAITLCAIKGESRDQKLVDKLLLDFGASRDLSPKERAFIDNPTPTQDQLVDFTWRYECTHVFLWALGYLPDLGLPSEQANVAKEVAVLHDKGGAAFRKDAKLRSISELLDQNDLYYRLDWAAVDLRVKGRPNPKANEEIIVERHRALNWLIRYMNQAWDDVTTDT